MNPNIHDYVEEPRFRSLRIENVTHGHKNWFALQMINNGKNPLELSKSYGIDNKLLSTWKNKVL
jgi:hypothetical protein